MRAATGDLEVVLYGTLVGSLRSVRTGGDLAVRFITAVEGADRWGYGSRVLSANLPLSPTPATPNATAAFFGGLLPEGQRLAELARQSGRSTGDLIGLLRFTGGDVAGGLVLPGPEIESLGPRLSPQAFTAELSNPTSYLSGGGSSVAGVRPKVALGRSADDWHRAIEGHPSTHILKPSPADRPGDAFDEVFLMRLAREVGLTDKETTVVRTDQAVAVCAQRYDRAVTEDGAGVQVHRIHQEDAAQALGLSWNTDSKYESIDPGASYRAIASLLDAGGTVFAPVTADRLKLARLMAFTVAVGNTDAHAKNHSILHLPDGTVVLAPAYDVTCPILRYDANLNLALRIAGKAYLPDLTLTHLVDEAASWGLPQAAARAAIRDTLAATLAALKRLAMGSDTPDPRLPGLVATIARNLLAGDSAIPPHLLPPSLQTRFPVG